MCVGFGAYSRDASGMSLGALFMVQFENYEHSITFDIQLPEYATRNRKKHISFFRSFGWMQFSWNRRRILFPQCTLNVCVSECGKLREKCARW